VVAIEVRGQERVAIDEGDVDDFAGAG